ncbi:MAG: response regulator [Deltaproteobacteria bacterium]|nr:response regulator [Deltaproteobacteria bacterium]
MSSEIKALLAEDDELHREIIAELMQNAGMNVDVAGDGAKTIEMIQENDYDVVISDLVMPNKNGMDVLRAAKSKSGDILVVIVTGFGSMETLIEAIREGAYDYLTKPFKLDELRLLLRNVMEKIKIERANRKLAVELDRSREQVDTLSREKERLRVELEETRAKMLEHEGNLGSLLSQFPFLVGATTPRELRSPGEEESKTGSGSTATKGEKKLITKV